MARLNNVPRKCKQKHVTVWAHASCDDCHRYAAYEFFHKATKIIKNGCEVHRIIK